MSVPMKSPDGRLYDVEPSEVEALTRDQGFVPAAPEETAKLESERERHRDYGGAGQQAIGLAETFLRSARPLVDPVGTALRVTGAIPNDQIGFGTEQEMRDRAVETDLESPVLNTAAGLAPAVIAGVATGGATAPLGVGTAMGAEAVIGGLSAVGGAQDAAFKHDQELSAEAALGAFGGGFLLGGATAGVFRAAGAVRNRFVEASGKMARKAEQEAFQASGVVRPITGLAEAVDDPVKAAALRKAGAEAKPVAQQKLVDELRAMESAEQTTAQSTAARALDDAFPSSPTADVAAQRSATRNVIANARDEFVDAPAVRGRMERAMEALDRSDTPDQILATARSLRSSIDEALDAADDPALASRLKPYAAQARELEGNAALFGGAGESVAAKTAARDALVEARIALQGQFEAGNYLGKIGTVEAKHIDDALETYMTRLGNVLEGSDDPAAKEGLDAIGRLRAARDTEFQAVAGANQADALRKFAKDSGGATGAGESVMRDLLGEAAETAVEAVIPGAGLMRKAWKYRKHVLRLSGGARQSAGVTADRLVGTALTSVGRGSRALTRAATPLGMRALAMSDVDENPERAYSRIRETVRTLVQEPEKLADSLAAQMGDIPTEAPELLDWVNAKAARVVDFLAEKIPPAFEYSLLYPDGPPPSRSDVMEMSLYWHGVTQPEDVLVAIGDGSAMPEEIEAFRAANPAWFIELQEAIQERIVVANQAGKVIPGFRIAQLENLLDLHGKLDPAFSESIASVARMQEQAQEAQTQAPSYAPKPRAGERISAESTAV